MKVVDKRKSIEQCTESGWDAFDLMVSSPLTDEDIESLRVVEGSFLYLKQLKKPFFKVENHNYVIKGVKGDDHFRFAVHKDYLDRVDQVMEMFS